MGVEKSTTPKTGTGTEQKHEQKPRRTVLTLPGHLDEDMNQHNTELVWMRAFVHQHGGHHGIINSSELLYRIDNHTPPGDGKRPHRCRGAVLDYGTTPAQLIQCRLLADSQARRLCRYHQQVGESGIFLYRYGHT